MMRPPVMQKLATGPDTAGPAPASSGEVLVVALPQPAAQSNDLIGIVGLWVIGLAIAFCLIVLSREVRQHRRALDALTEILRETALYDPDDDDPDDLPAPVTRERLTVVRSK